MRLVFFRHLDRIPDGTPVLLKLNGEEKYHKSPVDDANLLLDRTDAPQAKQHARTE